MRDMAINSNNDINSLIENLGVSLNFLYFFVCIGAHVCVYSCVWGPEANLNINLRCQFQVVAS